MCELLIPAQEICALSSWMLSITWLASNRLPTKQCVHSSCVNVLCLTLTLCACLQGSGGNEELVRDLQIASAYGSSLLAERDALINEIDALREECESAKQRLNEREEQLMTASSHNDDLYNSLKAADLEIEKITDSLTVSAHTWRSTHAQPCLRSCDTHAPLQLREKECSRLRSELETEREHSSILMRNVCACVTPACSVHMLILCSRTGEARSRQVAITVPRAAGHNQSVES